MPFAPDKLAAHRRARNLTQEELAALVGVSRSAVNRWESRASKPVRDDVEAAADVFGITIDDLFDRRSGGGAADGN